MRETSPRGRLARQAGFTLVELISVLVILGVLSAVSLPRYSDLSESARRAAIDGTTGALASAVAIANAGCLLRAWQGRDNLPGYGDGRLDFNLACFPTDTTGNANTIGNTNARCMRVWNGILLLAPTVTTGNSGADYRARARNQVCTFQYLGPTSTTRQITYDSRSGAVAAINP